MAEPEREPIAPAAPPAGGARRNIELAQARLRPMARQAWQNLKIWIPFLLNRTDRARQVIYHAREQREGFTWRVRLPAQCWQCGAEAELLTREIEVDLRSFEQAVTIVAAAAGSALFFMFLASLFGGKLLWVLALASVGVGIALLLLKSWTETVRVEMSTCREHAEQMRLPGMVLDQNELHLFLPSDSLAGAARGELRAARLGRGRALPGGGRGAESDVEPPPEHVKYRQAFGAPPTPLPELPPIRLADEEE